MSTVLSVEQKQDLSAFGRAVARIDSTWRSSSLASQASAS